MRRLLLLRTLCGLSKQQKPISNLKKFQIIRHNIHSSRKCFSSSASLFNCIPSITVHLKEKSPKELLFQKVIKDINSYEFDKAVLSLKASETRLEPSQLLTVIEKLSSFRRFTHLKTVYGIYRSDILKHTGLLVTMIDSSYLERDYTLFESLFDHYMQTQYLTSYYFNMALKVFLRTNPQLAKQLLYQMMCQEYPIDDETIYIFLRLSNRLCTFETIKFVVELVKRNPNVPVDDRAYGVMVDCYLRNASDSEYDELMEFLKTINADSLVEVRMALFINEITGLEMSEVWEYLMKFKQENVLTKDKLERLYKMIYHRFSHKMSGNDLKLYLKNYFNDGLKTSPELQKNIMSFTKDESQLAEYLKDLEKTETIEYFHVKGLWRQLIFLRPDLAHEVNGIFKTFLSSNITEKHWIENALSSSEIVKVSNSRSTQYAIKRPINETEQMILYLKKLVNVQDDSGVLLTLQSLVREGKKPEIKVLMYAYKSLVGLKSSHSDKVYHIIHQLYHDVPMEVEIAHLEQQISPFKKYKVGNSSIKGIRMVKTFELKNCGKLNYKHYNQLASQMIDLRSYDNAVEYLLHAKHLITKEDRWGNMSVFVLLFKSLTWKVEPDNFIKLMKAVLDDKNMLISKYFLTRIVNYKHHLLKSKVLEKKKKEEFAVQFDAEYVKIKAKFSEQKLQFLARTNQIVSICDEWLKSR